MVPTAHASRLYCDPRKISFLAGVFEKKQIPAGSINWYTSMTSTNILSFFEKEKNNKYSTTRCCVIAGSLTRDRQNGRTRLQ